MSSSLPRRAGARRPLAFALLAPLALASLALGSLGVPAHADVCSSCAAPGPDDLAQEPGFSLQERTDVWGSKATDTLHTDGGECSYDLVGEPTVTTGKTWTVVRGSGVVMDCPWARTDGTVSFSIADGDSTEWSAKAELGAQLGAVVAKITAGLAFGLGGGATHGEVVTVSQHIEAGAGHVLDWTGYFHIADLTLNADVAVSRRFAWWTKNQLTGHTVHAKGDHWASCGTEQVTLTRRASLAFSIGFIDTRCDGTGEPIDRGLFPPAPVPPPPVITPPSSPLPSPPAVLPLDEPAMPPAPQMGGEPGSGDEPFPFGEPGPIDEPGPVAEPGPTPVPAPAPAPFVPPPTSPTPGVPESSGELPIAPTGPLTGFPTGDPSEGMDD